MTLKIKDNNCLWRFLIYKEKYHGKNKVNPKCGCINLKKISFVRIVISNLKKS